MYYMYLHIGMHEVFKINNVQMANNIIRLWLFGKEVEMNANIGT